MSWSSFYGVILMTKKDVIQLLEKIAIYMELKGENTFKVSAYRKAAQSLEVDERTLEEIDDVTELKGIGKGVGEVINLKQKVNHRRFKHLKMKYLKG